MVEIDDDLIFKIIEMHTDMKYVRKTLEKHEEELQEQKKDYNRRLNIVEQNQSKIMTYIVLIGSAITIGLNIVFHLGDKIRSLL